MSSGEARRSGRLWVSWFVSAAMLVALTAVVTRFSEERAFAELVERSQPLWLALAAGLQAGTYLCDGRTMQRMLAEAGVALPLKSLVRLGLAKLFLDQAVPSAGFSGMVVMVHGLERRGVARTTTITAGALDVFCYFAAYLVALAAALGLAAAYGRLTLALLIPAAAFALGAGAVLGGLALFIHGGSAGLPPRLSRLERVRRLAARFPSHPFALAQHLPLLLTCVALKLLVFLLDATTLWAMLRAVGAQGHLPAVYASFMVATLARTVGIVPGGIGTFEAASVASLGVMGVPLAAALASTLLFRGISFWLPLVPGLVLARRESRP